MDVAIGVSKPQWPGYVPAFVLPPYSGAPPIPQGAAINPQQWKSGWWQYNPGYRPPSRSSEPAQSHVPWIPGHAWQQHIQPSSPKPTSNANSSHPSTQNNTTLSSTLVSAAATSYNPFNLTHVITPPSAEYLAQPLIANPLGLWEVSKGEKPNMAVVTPWIWNPAKLHADTDGDDTDEDDDADIAGEDDDVMSGTTFVASPNRGHKDKAQDYTTKIELRPTFSPSIVRTPSYYQQHSGVGPIPPPHSLSKDKAQGHTSKIELRPTFRPNIFRTPSYYQQYPGVTSLHAQHNQTQTQGQKPSSPRFLDGHLHVLSEEFEGIEGILSPLTLFDPTPLPAFMISFPAGDSQSHSSRGGEHRDRVGDPYALTEPGGGSGGSRQRDDRYRYADQYRDQEREGDNNSDHERAEQKEKEKRAKRDAEWLLRTVQAHVHSLVEEPPPVWSYPNPNTQISLNAGAAGGRQGGKEGSAAQESTPTPNQQQAAQYAHARAQQERRQQEYAYYRALEWSRSGEGANAAGDVGPSGSCGADQNPASAKESYVNDVTATAADGGVANVRTQQDYKYHRALEQSRSGDASGGGGANQNGTEHERSSGVDGAEGDRSDERERGLRSEPTREAISASTSATLYVSPSVAQLSDGATGLTALLSAQRPSGSDTTTTVVDNGANNAGRWASWHGERPRGRPVGSAKGMNDVTATAGDSAKAEEIEEVRQKAGNARIAEEELRRKEEARKMEKEAQEKAEETKRKEEEARLLREQLERQAAILKQKEIEVQRKESEVSKREETLKQKEEAHKLREQAERKAAEAKQKEIEAKRKETEVREKAAALKREAAELHQLAQLAQQEQEKLRRSNITPRPPPYSMQRIIDSSHSRSPPPDSQQFASSSSYHSQRRHPFQHGPASSISLQDMTNPSIEGPNFNPIAAKLAQDSESIISFTSSHSSVTTEYGSIFRFRDI